MLKTNLINWQRVLKYVLSTFIVALIMGLAIILSLLPLSLPTTPALVLPAIVSSPYLYSFSTPGALQESSSSEISRSPYWWLSAGGEMIIEDGIGKTIQGNLPPDDKWRLAYALSNPTDTDSGYHPQNIFRLVSRNSWGNASQEAYFTIIANNLSSSPNRNSSNGLLLFNRYKDSDNLYYAGIRVDGAAVIKKKIGGTYYTLAYTPGIYSGNYDKNTNPNLIPRNKWVGLKSQVTNLSNGRVEIKLYIDKGWSGIWVLAASAVDDGKKYGGPAFTSSGFGGIRTDFMDVVFENFRFKSL